MRSTRCAVLLCLLGLLLGLPALARAQVRLRGELVWPAAAAPVADSATIVIFRRDTLRQRHRFAGATFDLTVPAARVTTPLAVKVGARAASGAWAADTTLLLAPGDTVHALRLTLRPDVLCFDYCDPDPRRVAVVRSARQRWGCFADEGRAAQAVEELARHLADPTVRARLGLSVFGRTAAITPVRQDATCRRLAQALERQGYAMVSTRFLVFRVGQGWYVEQADAWHPMMLDASLRVVPLVVWLVA